jgi:hypothetical protein
MNTPLLYLSIVILLLFSTWGCENPGDPDPIPSPLFAYVVNVTSMDITKINMNTRTIETIRDTLDFNPCHLTYWNKKGVILNKSPSSVTVVDFLENIIEGTVDLQSGDNPQDMLVYSNKFGILNNRGTGTITILDLTIKTILKRFPVTGGVEGIALMDTLLFVASPVTRWVQEGEALVEKGVVKVASFGSDDSYSLHWLGDDEENSEMYTPRSPKLLAFDSRETLYIACWNATTPCRIYAVSIDDTLGVEIDEMLEIGGRPDRLLFGKNDTGYLLESDIGIMCFNTDSLEAVHDSKNLLLSEENPNAMALDDSGNLYICLPLTDELVVLSPSLEELHRFPVGTGPVAVDVGR